MVLGTYLLQGGEVSSIRGAGHAGWHQALHQEGNTEDVHAGISQDLDLGGFGPGVVGTEGTGDVALAELSTGLAHTDPGESIGALVNGSALLGVDGMGKSAGHGCGTGSKSDVGELHLEM